MKFLKKRNRKNTESKGRRLFAESLEDRRMLTVLNELEPAFDTSYLAGDTNLDRPDPIYISLLGTGLNDNLRVMNTKDNDIMFFKDATLVTPPADNPDGNLLEGGTNIGIFQNGVTSNFVGIVNQLEVANGGQGNNYFNGIKILGEEGKDIIDASELFQYGIWVDGGDDPDIITGSTAMFPLEPENNPVDHSRGQRGDQYTDLLQGGNESNAHGEQGDTIFGGPGPDVIDGQNGNDTLDGQGGSDAIYGGNGDDDITTDGYDGIPGKGTDDVLMGGTFGDPSQDTGDHDVLRAEGQLSDYDNVDFEIIYGSIFDDQIDSSGYYGPGTDRNNDGDRNDAGDYRGVYVYGDKGNDTIVGSQYQDYLDGEQDDDTISGGGGNDFIYGKDGEDTLNGGGGNDEIRGGAGDDTLNGNDGNDKLWGDGGDDVLNGGDGNDELKGGDDNDTLDGGAGADKIWGENGEDTVTYKNSPSRVIVDLEEDDDSNNRASGGHAQGDYFPANPPDIENLVGSEFDDILDGNRLANAIDGLGGNDEIRGDGDVDVLFGNDGDDTLDGEGGLDHLYGQAGDDTLKTVWDTDSPTGFDDAHLFGGEEDAFDTFVLGGILDSDSLQQTYINKVLAKSALIDLSLAGDSDFGWGDEDIVRFPNVDHPALP